MKLEYFQNEWADKPEWITIAQNEAIALWTNEYKASDLATSEVQLESMATSVDVDGDVRWKRNKRARLASDVSDPFEAFQERQGEVQGPMAGLNYWIQARALGDIHSGDLVNMGLAIQSIPGMSAEPERVFSR